MSLARPIRGMQRWKQLPAPADFASELGLNLPKSEFEEEAQLKLSQSSLKLSNAPMVNIIEDWRSQWKLGTVILDSLNQGCESSRIFFASASSVFLQSASASTKI